MNKQKKRVDYNNKKERYSKPFLKKQKALWKESGASVGVKMIDCCPE